MRGTVQRESIADLPIIARFAAERCLRHFPRFGFGILSRKVLRIASTAAAKQSRRFRVHSDSFAWGAFGVVLRIASLYGGGQHDIRMILPGHGVSSHLSFLWPDGCFALRDIRFFRVLFAQQPKKKKPYISLIHKAFCFLNPSFSEGSRAENETRTRDPNLGKVVLYQLSYFRIIL